MDFLNNIKSTKSDQKPLSLLSQLPFCPCEEPNHQMYTLNMVCLEKSCASKGLICLMCNYERHKQHEYIPLKNFLDQYQQSYYLFQSKQSKDELKVSKIQEINWATLGVLKVFQEKIAEEIANLQAIVRSYSEQEINAFLEEEENSKDPLMKLSGHEDTCDTRQAMALVCSLLDRVIYKDNGAVDTDNLGFLHPSNDVLFKKFSEISDKALKNQEYIVKRLDEEFGSLKPVFEELTVRFGLTTKPKPPISVTELDLLTIAKQESFVLKSDFTALCFFDEVVNNQKFDFLASEAEDNRFKLFRFENGQEQAFFVDLHLKHSIKHLEYCKKMQMLVGIDCECNLFTVRFRNQTPFFFPNWTSHHFKDLFSRSEINARVVKNSLILGFNSFIYILTITNEGVIEIKVKIEINGQLEFLSEGQNEVFFVWNRQNSLKKCLSVLELEKGTIRNLDTVDINYQIKGFAFYKEMEGFVFWGSEFKGNKEFLEVVQGEKRRKCFLEKNIRLLKFEDFEQNLYLFQTNNGLDIVKIVKGG